MRNQIDIGKLAAKGGQATAAKVRALREEQAEVFLKFVDNELRERRVPTKKQALAFMRDHGYPLISKNRITALEALVDRPLSLLRIRMGSNQTESQLKKISDEAEKTWLDWSPLTLFDRLMARFRVVESEVNDELDKDGSETPEGDFRSTWISWRVFIAAAFGLPQEELSFDHSKPSNEDRSLPTYPGTPANVEVPRGAAQLRAGMTPQEIFAACTGRSVWPTWQSRLVSLIVGRRGGKSYVTAIIGIYLALCRRYRFNLGTKGMVMILARDKDQANTIRNYIIAFLKADPDLRRFLKADPTQTKIELINDVTIEVRATGEASTRGYTVVAVLADEIAFWPTDEKSARQDKKVLKALKPAMYGVKNAMIVMLSSPYAKRGQLYEAWRRAFGKDDERRWFVWQADTLSMRPTDDPDLLEEISSEYDDDAESAKAEYGAQFRSDLEQLFSKESIEALAAAGAYELAPIPGRLYRAFVDPSGGSSDSYVIAIAHDEPRHDADKHLYYVPVLDYVKEWVPKFDPEQVSLEVVEICRRFGITHVTGDAYGGEWPRDPLKKKGIGYVLSEKTRSELYLDLLPIVNSGRCVLLDVGRHRKLLNQLVNLERRTGRSGKDTVDHPPGSHDDVANAVAGVLVISGVKSFDYGNCEFGIPKTVIPMWRQ